MDDNGVGTEKGEPRAAGTCTTCGRPLTQCGPNGECLRCLVSLGFLADGQETERSAARGRLTPGPLRYAHFEVEVGADGFPVEIGAGAMAVTYRARDTVLNSEVALKVIDRRVAQNPGARSRFLREARAAANIHHPNVARVTYYGEQDGECFYAMELVEGETLEARVRRDGPMPLALALQVIEQAARALAVAEMCGVVHRDIKPSNLMLESDPSEALMVKVIDYGVAKIMGPQAEPSAEQTQVGFIGTPAFASPEEFAGAGQSSIDTRSDIYALGVTLWYLLTGRTPFVGRTMEEIRVRQTSELPLEQLKGLHLPGQVVALLKSMLAPDPKDRPQTARDLLSAVHRCYERFNPQARSRRKRFALAGAALALAIVAIALGAWLYQHTRPFTPMERSIAVLPFGNLSSDKENAYFVEGIQDEILTRLSKIADLKVISRTSTQHYKSAPENLREIARELGVAHILEGSVQKSGDAVRVNVQLINAATDSHVWADTFDRKLTDIFSVESEVSQKIAAALQANLSPNESHVLAAVRTPDTEAYDLFLRGEYEFRQAQSNESAETYDRADAFYRQALARDPNFAEAAAALARGRLTRHWFVSPLEPAELEEVKSLVDRALALAPNSPQAHLALGLFFYWGHRQYQMALTEFNRTLELQPNSALARTYCAWVYRRRGEWERSLAEFQRAQELDPRDVQIPQNIGATYLTLRQWKDAEQAELRALAIDPHNGWSALSLLISHLNATGDVGAARRALDGFPEATKSLTLVSRRSPTGIGDVAFMIGMWVYLDVMERRFTEAFQAFDKEVVNKDPGRLQQLAGRAALRLLAAESDMAKSAGEEALPSLEARLRERPDDTFAMTELSWVYLALRRNADALRLSRQAADAISIEKDAFSGPNFQIGLAQIEARVGAPEEAIRRLRRLLSIPAGWEVSIARLKIDPVWDPIRNRPDFQQLLSGPEQIGPNK